ncbi:hypothetical protein HYH02_000924 [Chlamydomonas schloesseri]|uniref:Pherophorin domain-containing protein n=1 Tax=Chlamydomonas schloesseri TaxID=2026947 RepID=A0A835WX71_9CHLO|nr:hypothetical protein HYH02_000924 [Chlamydomonas schloesseri]|eukprot:KAG2455104.1 hypothetical protein HYH02_000924 [Chlamydomonas schloesseri]
MDYDRFMMLVMPAEYGCYTSLYNSTLNRLSPTGDVLSSQPLWPIWSWNEVWDPSIPDQTWNQLIYTGLGVDQYNGTGTQICFQLGAPCPSISDLCWNGRCLYAYTNKAGDAAGTACCPSRTVNPQNNNTWVQSRRRAASYDAGARRSTTSRDSDNAGSGVSMSPQQKWWASSAGVAYAERYRREVMSLPGANEGSIEDNVGAGSLSGSRGSAADLNDSAAGVGVGAKKLLGDGAKRRQLHGLADAAAGSGRQGSGRMRRGIW